MPFVKGLNALKLDKVYRWSPGYPLLDRLSEAKYPNLTIEMLRFAQDNKSHLVDQALNLHHSP
jgi:hypothetical protein